MQVSGPQLLRALTSAGKARGGQLGNQNALKALVWEDNYDLSNPNGIRRFLVEVIKAVWEGKLGTRAASSLNGSLRLIFELVELPELEKRIEQMEAERQTLKAKKLLDELNKITPSKPALNYSRTPAPCGYSST